MNKIICFIGIDGSGKSTLSRYLYEELKKRNYDVSYTWWLEGDNSSLRRLLRKIGKRKTKNMVNRKEEHTGLFRILYPNIVLLDYLRFCIVKIFIPKLMNRNRILIFDRYIYDVILAISKEFGYSENTRMKLFTVFRKLLPKVDLLFFIDVPPEISYMRKKYEIISLDNAKIIFDDYQKMLGMIYGNVINIDNTQEIEFTENKILDITLSSI